jgi:hypothetical protein
MAHELASALAADVDNVARALLGEPSLQSPNEFRYGQRGSIAIVRRGPKRGLCFDFESGEGGDLIWLIMRAHGVDFRRALEIAREIVGGRHIELRPPPTHHRELVRTSYDAQRRQAFALTRWQKRKSYRGSPAQRYLLSRGLEVSAHDFDHVLGWDPDAHAVLALMTDPISGKPCGIHRPFLDRDARKIERKMLGQQGVIQISGYEDVADALGVGEGLEDALAVFLSGWRPIWAATSAGALARFPVIPGITALTIFADRDSAGTAAATTCAARWCDQEREAVIWMPGASNG